MLLIQTETYNTATAAPGKGIRVKMYNRSNLGTFSARKLKFGMLHSLTYAIYSLDACPTGDQEVAGSTPARSAIFFRGD